MRMWQDPAIELGTRLLNFADAADLDTLCVRRLRRLPPRALEELLNKQRWGVHTDNTNAVVSAEAKRARPLRLPAGRGPRGVLPAARPGPPD
eukprot:7302424-Alexandrium_andersonii.AAC.1